MAVVALIRSGFQKCCPSAHEQTIFYRGWHAARDRFAHGWCSWI